MADIFNLLWYLGVFMIIAWGIGRFISILASSNLGRFLLMLLGLSLFFVDNDDDMDL